MTKTEALNAIYQIRQALVLANKLCPSNKELEDALVLATRLIFYFKKGSNSTICRRGN